MEDTFDMDVGIGEEDESNFQKKEQFLKMTTNQVILGSFVYFHTYDVNAAMQARSLAKKEGREISQEALKEVGKKALEARATALGKSVSALTPTEKLDLSESKFKRVQAHYQQGLGFVLSRLGLDGAEADSVWKKLPEVKSYFTTALLIYPTNAKGVINKEALTSGWSIVPWRFGPNVYEEIWKLNAGLRSNNLGLHSQDIRLECKDGNFQNIKPSAAGPAIWQRNEKFREKVLVSAMEYYDKLIPFRAMTTDALRAKLGMGGSSTSVGDFSSSPLDLSEFLDQV